MRAVFSYKKRFGTLTFVPDLLSRLRRLESSNGLELAPSGAHNENTVSWNIHRQLSCLVGLRNVPHGYYQGGPMTPIELFVSMSTAAWAA